MLTIAIFGAAGNMGTRVSNRLKDDPEYRLLFVEAGETGEAKLRERGLTATRSGQAVAEADVVFLAVPDKLILGIAAEVVPELKGGTIVVCLDPAAPYSRRLPERDDITYFVTHPTHPPVFNDETDLEAKRDFFGSGLAKQSIVCALLQGSEEHYAVGEQIARKVFGPLLRSHRVTVDQMALLEPVLAETVGCTCLAVIREALDEAVRRGVPADAARDFILGHVNIALAILFNETDWQFSDGAKRAIALAKEQLFKPDWKKVFEPQVVRASVATITGS